MKSDAASPIQELESSLASCAVMAVLRGMNPEETTRLADIAWEAGFRQVEVPIESPAALASLEAAIEAGARREMPVGAGTIITRSQLDEARARGAAYGVSPGLDPDLVKLAQKHDWPFLPGVSTPTEILLAKNLGLKWVKAFPASVLGPGWLSAMKGPFPDMFFVATGGVNGNNASVLLEAGASVVGVGRALGDASQLAQLRAIANR